MNEKEGFNDHDKSDDSEEEIRQKIKDNPETVIRVTWTEIKSYLPGGQSHWIITTKEITEEEPTTEKDCE